MKKVTAILLTLCFAMLIVGCGEDTGKPAKKDGGTKPATETKS